MNIILSFDVGTTAMKCCAFNEKLELVASAATEYPLTTHGTHIVEVEPELYWNGLCVSTREILTEKLPGAVVAAVAITTQGETMIPIDKNGTPLTPAIVWLDDRAGEQAARLTEQIGSDRLYHTTGLSEITGAAPIAKLKWLAEQKELQGKIYKILLLEDYLIYRLTGVFATEGSLVCSTGYYDIFNHCYEKDFLSLTGIREEQICPVLPCGTIAGAVTEAAGKASCLPAGTPVVCTAMDQTASAVGAGNIMPGIITETTGTCLTVAATVDTPVLDAEEPLQYYTHYDGRYLALAYNSTAAAVMKWYKEQFIADSASYLATKENPYEYMGALASKIPAGSEGLYLIPHFTGKTMPGSCPDMRGCFMGLGLHVTKAHMIRAVMEGVACMLRENLEVFRKSGIPVEKIRSLGGGSRDRLWCAIKASVTGCELTAMDVSESTSLGAAVLAAHALDESKSVADLCAMAVRSKETYRPAEQERETYDAYYKKYLQLDRLTAAFYTEEK